jgi:hypothetical protein
VFNNNLIIVNNESFFIYSIKDNYNCQNFPATHRGVCVGSVIWNNRLYLGYENGSICFLEESNKDTSNKDTSNKDTSNKDTSNKDTSNKDTSNKDTSNEDTSNKDTSNEDTSNKDTSNEDTSNEDTSNKDTSNSSISVSEIIKMDESISSFDIFNDLICIAFFDKKIAVCDSKGNNFKYTEIKFNPKIIKFWKMHILCLDGENNLFLLDINLKILYCENFENNLISFDIIDDLMYQIYKDGTIIIQENIKEYIN